MRDKKIGVFDSGLGGLFIFRSLIRELPQYDYIYLGDTKRVPYGNRSHDTIYQFLEEAVRFLFSEGCEIVIVACNTASAMALREIQQKYLPKHDPKKRVLGVIIPTAEEATDALRIGILATQATVESEAFPRELKKLDPKLKVYQNAAPLLVPLIEQNKIKEALPFLREYLAPLIKEKIDTLILGCTHYGILEKEVRKIVGPKIRIVSQNSLIPGKLKNYLEHHPEINDKLSKNKKRQFMATDLNGYYKKLARSWFGHEINLELISLGE